jgi:hypothetical protein
MSEHLDDDVAIFAGIQAIVNFGKFLGKPNVNHAAAHGNDVADIPFFLLFFH